MGGNAPVKIAYRQQIRSTPYEVVAVVPAGAVIQALAAYQKIALVALGALVFLSLLWTVLMGSGRTSADDERDLAPKDTVKREVPPPAVTTRMEDMATRQVDDAA